MRVLQCRATAEYGDAAMRQQARQPFRHRFHGGDAEITQSAEIDALQRGVDAHAFGVMDGFDAMHGGQQCLRWDASAVEACATERTVTFDQRHRFAELRSTQCRRVTAGASSDDSDVEMLLNHIESQFVPH